MATATTGKTQMYIDGRLPDLVDGGGGVAERRGRLNETADDSSGHGEL